MTPYGLSEHGFKPKDFTIIKKQMEDALQKEVDPGLHFSPNSVAGVMTGIVANQARQVWEALSGLYHSLQPDTATGRALDALCSLTGTYRKQASKSHATVMVRLKAKTALPSGSRIKTVAGDLFTTKFKVKNESDTEKDCLAELIAEESGDKLAYAGSNAEIATPVAGWSSAEIIETTLRGRDDESDEDLRIRRIAELKATGLSTADSMRDQLRKLKGVDAVHIMEGDGSFEVVIQGGSERDIAYAIWRCKPLGIRTEGKTQYKIVDAFEQERIINFSRPEVIALRLIVSIKVKTKLDEKVFKAALVSFAKEHFELGGEVYSSRFIATVLDTPDVLDVVSLQLLDQETGKVTPDEIKSHEIASVKFQDVYVTQSVEAAE